MKSHVKRIMAERNQTVRGLAAQTGQSPMTIVRASKDDAIETLTLATLAKIAAALRVSVKELFDG